MLERQFVRCRRYSTGRSTRDGCDFDLARIGDGDGHFDDSCCNRDRFVERPRSDDVDDSGARWLECAKGNASRAPSESLAHVCVCPIVEWVGQRRVKHGELRVGDLYGERPHGLSLRRRCGLSTRKGGRDIGCPYSRRRPCCRLVTPGGCSRPRPLLEHRRRIFVDLHPGDFGLSGLRCAPVRVSSGPFDGERRWVPSSLSVGDVRGSLGMAAPRDEDVLGPARSPGNTPARDALSVTACVARRSIRTDLRRFNRSTSAPSLRGVWATSIPVGIGDLEVDRAVVAH